MTGIIGAKVGFYAYTMLTSPPGPFRRAYLSCLNELLSKLLVSPLITPIVVPYVIPYITPPLRSLDYGSNGVADNSGLLVGDSCNKNFGELHLDNSTIYLRLLGVM